MFRAHVLSVRRSKLYYTASGIITPIGGRPVHGTATNLMHKLCSTISLFHASTCFEHHVLIVRWSKLYYTASGIITLKQVSGLKLLK